MLLTRHILHEYIGIDTFDCEDELSKLISFHVRLHVHNLDIAKVTRLLEPISKLETKSLSLHPDPTTPFAQTSVVSPEYTVGQKRLPNISLFIVAKLFGAFSEAASTTNTDKLTQWHRSYLGIVSLQFKFWQAWVSPILACSMGKHDLTNRLMVSVSVTCVPSANDRLHIRTIQVYTCYIMQCIDLTSHAVCRRQSAAEFSI